MGANREVRRVPTRSKFTSERRRQILEILSAGGSRRAAAARAGIDHATLSRWLARGRRGAPGGRWHQFERDVAQAETHPALRALREEYDKLSDSPMAAIRFLDEHTDWVAEDEPELADGPVVIELKLPDNPPRLREGVMEGDDDDDD
jgi:transposase-like protein